MTIHRDLNEVVIDVDEAVNGWGETEHDIELFAELWRMKETTRFPKDQWHRLQGLIQQLGNYLLDDLSKQADWALNQTNSRDRISGLVRVRDQMKNPNLPRWLKNKLQDKLDQVYVALNDNSKREADALVYRTTVLLDTAEKNLFDERLPAEFKLRELQSVLAHINRMLTDLRPHIVFVGLPAVAEALNLGKTADDVLAMIQLRVEVLESRIPELEAAVKYEDDHAQEIAAAKQQRLEQERKEAEQQRLQAARDQMLAAIKRRSNDAFNAAEQFYRNLSLGNVGAAWQNMQKVQRLDGGITPMMQRDYGNAAKQKSLRETA